MSNNKELWQELSKKNLVEGKAPKLEIESPWFMKFIVSISGWWVAVSFILFFGGIIDNTFHINIVNTPFILTPIGIGLIIFVYNRFQDRQSDFLEHFLLAISIAGQVFIIGSFMIMLENNQQIVYLFVAIFQAFLMWIIPNYIHRTISSFFTAMALAFFFYNLNLFPFYLSILTFVVAWLFINEFYFDAIKKIQAISYGLLSALVWLKISVISSFNILNAFDNSANNSHIHFFSSLTEILSIFTLIYVVWKILEQNNKLKDKKVLLFSLISVVLLGLISFAVSGLVTGIIFLIIGFSSSNRLLIGLGIISSLLFISNYYYNIGETLLDKAIVLASVGLVLLAFRWLIKKFLFKDIPNV